MKNVNNIIFNVCLILGYLICLIHVNESGTPYDIGLCKPWSFTCQCGRQNGYPVKLELKQCLYFKGFRTHCDSCNNEKPDNICPRFQNCLSCETDNMEQCLTCPPNRFGKFCSNICTCENGGKCDANGDCSCPSEFEGAQCQTSKGCIPPYASPPLMETRLPQRNPVLIEYRCPPYQELVGEPRISCLSTRIWSHPVPTCRLSCSVPLTPANSVISVSRNPMELGDTVYFTCQDGFTMFGANQLTCQENAKLDGKPPHCEKVTECPKPPDVVQATHTIDPTFDWAKNRYFNGTRVHYKCATDLFLLGSPSLKCQDDGSWSSPPPKCIFVSDINVECDTTGLEVIKEVGLLVRIQCPTGCSMTNDSVYGTVIYSGHSSVCRSGVHSGKLTNVGGPLYLSYIGPYTEFLGSSLNGVNSESILSQGRGFRFHVIGIEENFQRKDNSEFQGCPKDWTEIEGFCVFKVTKSTAWSMSRNTCQNMGSRLPSVDEPALLKALQKTLPEYFETWLESPIRPASNGSQIIWADENIEEDEFTLGFNDTDFDEDSSLPTECTFLVYQDENFVLKSKNCKESNHYHCVYSLTEEIEEQCEDPGPLENGFATLEGTGFKIGTIIKYRCSELHYMSGSSVSICTDSLTWSTTKPRCIRVITCTEPPRPDYALLEILPPLEIQGNAARMATRRSRLGQAGPRVSRIASRARAKQQSDNVNSTTTTPTTPELWTPDDNETSSTADPILPPPRVRRSEIDRKALNIENKEPPTAAKNVPLPPGHYKVGSRVSYDCESRFYEFLGSKNIKCQADGTWSGTRPPACFPICGKSDSPRTPFIVNGNSSEAGQWPWQVAISKYTFEFNTYSWFLQCGASLLTEQWVVTAAHCVTVPGTDDLLEIDSLRLQFGKYHRNNELDDEQVQMRKAKEIHVFQDYHPGSFDADIAMIRLNEPVMLTSRVQPICLPSDSSTRLNIVEGKRGVATGWGITEEDVLSQDLRQAVLPVVSHKKCEDDYEKLGQRLEITDYMYCAGYEEGVTDTCEGDSGGPMVFLDETANDKRWVLEGIVSWGSPTCGNQFEYGGFTRVSKFLNWIYQFV